MTRNIIFVEDLPSGRKLYEKTGSGSQLNQDKTQKLDLQIGWFVGWMQKDNRTIIFANYIKGTDKQDNYGAPGAKASARERLIKLIKGGKECKCKKRNN
jgi:beta-lactamase class D